MLHMSIFYGSHILKMDMSSENIFYYESCPKGENVLLGDGSNWSAYHTGFKHKFLRIFF